MTLQQVLQMPLQAGKKSSLWTLAGQGVPLTIQVVENDTKQDSYGNWIQTVKVLDKAGGTQGQIKHKSKFPDGMLNQSHVGKDAVWRLHWYQGQRGQVLEGYPEKKISGEGTVTAQTQPTIPYSAPQTPQQAPQTANADDKWKLKDECICRQCAGKAAAEIVSAFVPVSSGYTINQAMADTLTLADALSMWFISGNTPADEPDNYPFS